MPDYTPHQLENARLIIAKGKQMGISPRGQVGALATGLVETNLKVYANRADPPTMALPHVAVGSDSLSSGVFQQQPGKTWDANPSWWGTVQCRMDTSCAAGQYYERLRKVRIDGKDYNTLDISGGRFCQAVQQSSFPTRYDERWGEALALYDRLFLEAAGIAPAAPAPTTYGLPRGSNSGGYGGSGVRFPEWVYALGNHFGVKPSTYKGHQETNRNEPGYAPNPQLLNRGIDWAAPGDPDEIDKLQRLADYLATIPQHLEQIIWRNPRTRRSIEAAGGRHQPGYFGESELRRHENHVHTRQSKPIPLPAGVVVSTPAPLPPRPQFEERQMFGHGGSPRSRVPINFLFHTEEGNSTAEGLARYCQGGNNVSYHYTLRDRIVYDVVDTDLYSWSVLAANAFTINLCFAGSRASWSREEWLRRIDDIEIACYLAVQDARKYGFSTRVIVPPYADSGAGIADHKFVTEQLGIGNHTDCGPNFPWDKVIEFVNKYTTTEDDMFNDHDRFLLQVLAEKRFPSRSPYAEDAKDFETVAGYAMNDDGMGHAVQVETGAALGIPKDLESLRRTAEGKGPGWLLQFPDSREYWEDRARRKLAEIEGRELVAAGGVPEADSGEPPPPAKRPRARKAK